MERSEEEAKKARRQRTREGIAEAKKARGTGRSNSEAQREAGVLKKMEAGGKGQEAEGIATLWLEDRGWTIHKRHFVCRGGELDIVAQDGETVVFVEVRFRISCTEEAAILSVGWEKQKRLWHAATVFLMMHPTFAEHPIRFDIVGLTGQEDGGFDLSHLRGAFDAE